MSAEGGTRAVIAALLANAFIAVTKFAAWALTGASSMLAEAIHSVADSGNQVLLLVGGRRSKRGATAQHPFGYGRERYVFGFIVSVVLFSVGGLFALYEAYHKWHEIAEGHPDELLESRWWWVPIVILVAAIIAESFSFRTAIRESNKTRGKQRWSKYIRAAKAPELPVILLEDFAALVGLIFALFGVGMTLLTHNGIFDVIGTAMIGLLLVAVAITLAVETKSLLLGEAASPEAVASDRTSADQHAGHRADHSHEDTASRSGGGPGRRQDRCRPLRHGIRSDRDDRSSREQHSRGRADGHRALPGAGHLRPELCASRAAGAARCAQPLVAGVLTTPRRRYVLTTVLDDVPLRSVWAGRFDGCAGRRTRPRSLRLWRRIL